MVPGRSIQDEKLEDALTYIPQRKMIEHIEQGIFVGEKAPMCKKPHLLLMKVRQPNY